jgi:hypothetical protein
MQKWFWSTMCQWRNYFWSTTSKCRDDFGVQWVNAEMILEYSKSMQKRFGVQWVTAEILQPWFYRPDTIFWLIIFKVFGIMYVHRYGWRRKLKGNKFSCLYTFHVKQCCCFTAHTVRLTLGWMLSSNMAQNADSGTKFPKHKNKSYIYIFRTKPNVSVWFFFSSEI